MACAGIGAYLFGYVGLAKIFMGVAIFFGCVTLLEGWNARRLRKYL
jgi:hypothetical protein